MMEETPHISIGHQLKCRREELGYSLAQVAAQTHIRKVYLEKIENEQFRDLPGKTYVVGFVRSYAKLLGLPSDPMIEHLEQSVLLGSQQSTDRPVAQLKYTTSPRRAVPAKGLLLFLAGLVLVLLLGGLVYWFTVGSSPQESRLPEPANETSRDASLERSPQKDTPTADPQETVPAPPEKTGQS